MAHDTVYTDFYTNRRRAWRRTAQLVVQRDRAELTGGATNPSTGKDLRESKEKKEGAFGGP